MVFRKKKESDESFKVSNSLKFKEDLVGERNDIGRTWIWTAIDAPTRLLASFQVAGHALDDAIRFVDDLADRLVTMPLFVSDELPHYATALANRYHTIVPFPPTGKPGRPKLPLKVIDPNLLYATVRKTRKGGLITNINRTIVFGDKEKINKIFENSPSNTINTSFIERSNLNWRQWDSHLTRKSMSFPKSIDYLHAKLAINILHYNFVRPHSTLSRIFDTQSNKNKYIPTTPAMKAGITDRPLSLPELLSI